MKIERIALFIPLLLAACTAAPAREAVPGKPTIVSLNPCTDAILAEVADPGQLLAISSYSHDPAASSMDLAKARRFAAVSGSVEELARLKPDLVIGSTFTGPATLAALERLGLRFEAFGLAGSVAESHAQVARIAALAGHLERGAALNARIDTALAKAAPPPGRAIDAIVWQSNGIVPGPHTLISELLQRTGFNHASARRGLGQAATISLEEMLASPPDVILAAGDPASNEDRMLAHPALAGLKHVRRARFDRSMLWCGGPTILKAATRLAEVRRGL